MAQKRNSMRDLSMASVQSASAGGLPGTAEAAIKVSESKAKHALETLQTLMKDGVLTKDDIAAKLQMMSGGNEVMLPGHDGREIAYTLHVIPHDEIEERTVLSPLNPRGHGLITERDLRDIILSFETGSPSIASPGLAYFDENGKISVYDGFRRRKACLSYTKSKVNYPVLVTSESVSILDFQVQDVKTEAKLPRTVRENGLYYKGLMKAYGFNNPHQLSNHLQMNYKTMSLSFNTADVSEEPLKLAYMPSCLGYRNINSLNTLFTSSSEEEFQQLVRYRDQYVRENEEVLSALAPASANNRVVVALEEMLAQIQGDHKLGTVRTKLLKFESRNVDLQRVEKMKGGQMQSSFVMTGLPKSLVDEMNELITMKIRELGPKHGVKLKN